MRCGACQSRASTHGSCQANVKYLSGVKQFPLYGGTSFDVEYKGFWSYPNKLSLSLHVDGFKFVHTKTKKILLELSYTSVWRLLIALRNSQSAAANGGG